MICWHWRGTVFTVDFSFFAVAALVAVRGGALYFLLLFLACLLHELGHLAMLLLFHRHVQTVSLCGAGALFVPSAACGAYWQDILVSLAGPAVNLLLAAALGLLGRWWEPLYLLAGAQAVLGCFNLLPILPLDGGRMLWLALCWGTDPFLADRVAQAVSLAAAGLLTVAGAALARRSPFLLWTAAALLVCAAAPCIKRRRSVYASHKGR